MTGHASETSLGVRRRSSNGRRGLVRPRSAPALSWSWCRSWSWGLLIRGARVRDQKLPVAISESSKVSGRSPRAVASTTIQERSW